MSKSLRDWLATDISPIKDQPISWISQHHFFRDPVRPAYSDMSYFFSPADGIILYQKTVRGDESIIDIKGRPYSLQDALRDPGYEAESLVIGIFMTMYDVHVNRVPYPGRLSYRELDPIDTINHPMLDVETSLLEDLGIAPDMLDYLHHNQRMVNRIDSPELGLSYFVLQIADYDVDCITPFTLKQHHAVFQGERFSQIRYGSQVDLIVPLSSRFVFETLQSTGDHVEAGVDALIRISERKHTSSSAEEDFPYAVKYGASVPHVSQ